MVTLPPEDCDLSVAYRSEIFLAGLDPEVQVFVKVVVVTPPGPVVVFDSSFTVDLVGEDTFIVFTSS